MWKGRLGFKLPKYVHIGPLMKMDGSSKRKLSKRKDPELALTYYKAEGFPIPSVREYIMTVQMCIRDRDKTVKNRFIEN